MTPLPASLASHRVRAADADSVIDGQVRWEPVRSLWFGSMALIALIGGPLTFSWDAVALYLLSTGAIILFGHSVGMHRKLIHDSFQCPRWLEYFLVYCGVLTGLSGPLGLLRIHDLRDYAQRLPDCHHFFSHRSGILRDGWWQLHCDLRLARPPRIAVEPRIAQDRFYQFLQRTWMAQQLPWALLLYGLGGWGYVCWGISARIATAVFGHWFVGYFAHHGTDADTSHMHHKVVGAAVQGRNVNYVALLSMGESWHNNHHAYPGSARLGLYAGEWDPGWWLLCGLRRLGLAWGLRTPQDLPFRAELQPVAPSPANPDARHPNGPARGKFKYVGWGERSEPQRLPGV